jgi:hypothetical protein
LRKTRVKHNFSLILAVLVNDEPKFFRNATLLKYLGLSVS